MNGEEQAEKNLEQARDFLTWLLDAPRELWPPDGATVVFTPDNDPELTEANRAIMVSAYRQDPDTTITMVSSDDGTFHVTTVTGDQLMGRGTGIEDERAGDERRGRATG